MEIALWVLACVGWAAFLYERREHNRTLDLWEAGLLEIREALDSYRESALR